MFDFLQTSSGDLCGKSIYLYKFVGRFDYPYLVICTYAIIIIIISSETVGRKSLFTTYFYWVFIYLMKKKRM